MLHWLPIAARIKFKVLMFAYKTTTGAAPIYLNLLVQTYAPSRSLRSTSERRLVVPSQRGTKSLSQTFSWTVPSWWNDLPISIRTAESLAIFKKMAKDSAVRIEIGRCLFYDQKLICHIFSLHHHTGPDGSGYRSSRTLH